MKPRTFFTKKTGSLLVAAVLLLTACDKTGPMGPEGPKGPDGANASGGGGSFTTYITDVDATLEWAYSDGWDGYGLGQLEINGKEYLTLPDSAVTQINNGAAVLVYAMIDDTWHPLPYKDNYSPGERIYGMYIDYVARGKELTIAFRLHGDLDIRIYELDRVKVIVAPASKANQLTL
jgi:hypothetical protein